MKIGAAMLAGWAAASMAYGAELQIEELRGMSLNDVLEVDIGTGTSKFLHQAPAVGEVITAEDIARLGARNLVDVLESIPGLNVHLYQNPVNAPIVDLRGSFTNAGGHLLFLRDGKPLRLLTNNTMPEIFRLPVHFIERIEIVRGPVSALYGSDALSGAVNIVTKNRPSEAGASTGTGGYRSAWVGRNGTAGAVEWAATVSYSRTPEEVVTRNAALGRTFVQEFDQQYSDVDLRLRSGGWHANLWALNFDKVERGNLANPAQEVDVDTQHRHVDVGYDADWGPTTQWKVALTRTLFDVSARNELWFGQPGNNDARDERTVADVTLTERRFASHRLRVNAGASYERRVQFSAPGAGGPPPGAPRTNRYLSLQDEYAFAPDWELTAGARADHYTDIGTVDEPRLGLVWNLNPRLTAKLLHGEAFRAPPVGLLGVTASEEQLRNSELAFDYRPNERWHAVWNLYRYRAANLAQLGPPGTPQLSRIGKGSEIELSWLAHAALRWSGAASYVSVADRFTGARVPYTPRTSAKLAVNWSPSERWSTNLRWEGYWDRVRPANDRRPPLEDIRLVHASLRYVLAPRSTLIFSAHNLLGSRAWMPVLGNGDIEEFQLAGRRLSVHLEHRF